MNEILNKKNGLNCDDAKIRNRKIINTSIVGIVANFFLALFKAIIGVISGSIAIILDAVNNLTDVASSVVTIIGAKFAAKRPDKEHPFGHGRLEYLSSMTISIIILYAGFTALIESIKKIINPIVPNYNYFSIIIVVSAIFVKLFLGNYVKKRGQELNSNSLINSGNDALLDVVISFSTLVAAVIFLFTRISTEAYLGVIISLIIIKSGISMVKESVSSILGERVDIEFVKTVKKTIVDFPEVVGVYDIVFNNYGPNSYSGSVHIEIPNTLSIDDVDQLSRDITTKVYSEHNVLLHAIGIYSVDKKNPKVISARKKVLEVIDKYDNIIQIHGFKYNDKKKIIQFDIVVSFDEENINELYNNFYNEISSLFKNFDVKIFVDNDFSVSI